MKKIKFGIFTTLTLLIFGCKSSYTVSTFQPDQSNGSDCPSPIYIGTMSISSSQVTYLAQGGVAVEFNQEVMTLVYLLENARKKYGEDVTIHNIRWDVKNGKKKTGVIYDVIKCK
jgi:hypothetical protein